MYTEVQAESRRAAVRKWRLLNPEVIAAGRRAYRASPAGRAKEAAWRLANPYKKKGPRAPSPRPVARAAAKQAGLPHYFTGLPCSRGHVDGFYVSSNQCRTCNRERLARTHKANPARAAAKAKKWRADNPEKCAKRGWKTQGISCVPPYPAPGHCECCKSADARGRGRWHLDHCHTTGKFRGWLCSPCNLAIGQLGDNLDGVMNAVAYLQAFENPTKSN